MFLGLATSGIGIVLMLSANGVFGPLPRVTPEENALAIMSSVFIAAALVILAIALDE